MIRMKTESQDSAENMQEMEMINILKEALYEFPIEDVKINMPEWIAILNHEHYLKQDYIAKIKDGKRDFRF